MRLPLVTDPVQKVCLGVSDLPTTTHYWTDLLGMKVLEKDEEKKTVLMGYEDKQVCQNEYVASEKYINIDVIIQLL